MIDPYKICVWILIYFIIGFSLPLLIIYYYMQRVALRWGNLWTRIQELQLEEEYLRIYHHTDWDEVKKEPPDVIRKRARDKFSAWYRGENSLLYYLFPFLLTLATTVAFAHVVHQALMDVSSLEALMQKDALLLFAVAGGFLYIYPRYVQRFASLHLSAPCLLELIGTLWLAVILGILFGYFVSANTYRPAAAFLGAYLPFAALDILKEKVMGANKDEVSRRDATSSPEFLEIIDHDEDMRSQLKLMGVRTVLELAYINPIKLFIETDLVIESCIYIVDRANLYLYVPDASIRSGLSRYGIKTCIDLMTQLYEYPDKWIKPDTSLPSHLEKPLEEIAHVMGLQSTDALRNIIDMMSQDPIPSYLLDFWQRLSFGIDENEASERESQCAVVQAIAV